MTQPNQPEIPVKSRFLGIASLVIFTSMMGLVILQELLLFKSMPMDGAFQLYNPLQSLEAGQIIGRDFDFFHGIGTLYLHYPAFVAFGSDLWASEMSRKLMSPLAFLLCFYCLAAAWRLPGYFASLAGCAVFVIGEATQCGSGALTGASMIGLRSTLPAVLLATSLLLARRVPRSHLINALGTAQK